MLSDCQLCGIAAHEADFVVFQNQRWAVVVSYRQLYFGRMLLVHKDHVADLDRLSDQDAPRSIQFILRARAAAKKAFGAETVNYAYLTNEAFLEEKPNPHVHWHLYPRYRVAPVFDEARYPDPNFGAGPLHEGLLRELDRLPPPLLSALRAHPLCDRGFRAPDELRLAITEALRAAWI